MPKQRKERIFGWEYDMEEVASSDGYPSYRSTWKYKPTLWDWIFNGCRRKPDGAPVFTVHGKTSLACFNRGCETIGIAPTSPQQ